VLKNDCIGSDFEQKKASREQGFFQFFSI